MKKVVAVFAGVAVAGLALAVNVTTANTAVVVRKNPVESADGYQFLCVPVRGFDITGQGQGLGVPLNDVLPPADFPVGATVQVQGNTDTSLEAEGTAKLLSNGTYIVMQEKQEGEAGPKFWGIAGSNADSLDSSSVGEDLLRAGAFLWLKASNPLSIFLAQDAPEPPENTFFCGEQNTREWLVPEKTSGMVAYGNDTDTAVDVDNVCADPKDGDEILRIKDGGKEYQYLEYYKDRYGLTGWYYYGATGIVKVPEGDDWICTIAPGEAFYYYRLGE